MTAFAPARLVRGWPARLAPWLLLLGIWYGLRLTGAVPAALLPAPEQVAATLGRLTADGSLPRHLLASAARVLVGLLIGTALAIPVGVLLGRVAAAGHLFDPVIGFFRALPPIALVPLVIVYLGIGEGAKVFVLSLSAFFAAVVVIQDGVAQAPPTYLHVARTLGASRGEVFRRVVLPQALPHILTALRLALGVTWATLVAAELVAAQAGLGAMIQVAASFFQLDVIYVGIGLIGLAALGLDWGLRRLSARLLSWQERAAR